MFVSISVFALRFLKKLFDYNGRFKHDQNTIILCSNKLSDHIILLRTRFVFNNYYKASHGCIYYLIFFNNLQFNF